jgi:NAD(P) transhydrogenase subunit alpha
MSNGMTFLTIFVLAVFVGFEVISKVSSVLHTPLMSGANAIHGVILVGAIIVAGRSDGFALVLALLAVLLATVNMVGGFVVTDRMLEMFGRGRRPRNAPPDAPQDDGKSGHRRKRPATEERRA